ncbi:uncharacterized protein TNCV_44771 [Trichonephila clavipes]|nr:uncharacterized protein TNCV_44771 [Trichonephila clavipes]
MPRFCNKTFKRRKFGSSKDSSASEDLKNGQEQPANTKVYEVNTRLAYAMRSVGKREAAAKVFCGDMNLPPPPKQFYESLHALNNATEKVAKVSMALAAAETLSFNNGNPNVPVAIDGTWQKGVILLSMAVSVDTGKVIDAEILSRKCSCHFNGNLHSDECSANYFGNSGGMEVEGALRIFNRSEVLHNLRYTQYLGDGDSKAYKAVLESKPYKDVNIEKLECVGHVEKRMGTQLRALKLKLKGKKLEDKKSLGGRNRLTDAEIDKLQRYYGLAIRNNSGNLSAMKQAIWAIFFHKISTDLNPQHGLCPLVDDSWCGYNRSKLKGLITKLKVLDLLNIQPGFYTCRALQEADHARIRKAEKAISRRTEEARIKNRQLKCRQEDDLADDPSNPSYGSAEKQVAVRENNVAVGCLVLLKEKNLPPSKWAMARILEVIYGTDGPLKHQQWRQQNVGTMQPMWCVFA